MKVASTEIVRNECLLCFYKKWKKKAIRNEMASRHTSFYGVMSGRASSERQKNKISFSIQTVAANSEEWALVKYHIDIASFI